MATNVRGGRPVNGRGRNTQNGSAPAGNGAGAQTPLASLSRRIREEQGISGLRDFLIAMGPFTAPNELRAVASGFGMAQFFHR